MLPDDKKRDARPRSRRGSNAQAAPKKPSAPPSATPPGEPRRGPNPEMTLIDPPSPLAVVNGAGH